MTLPKQFDLLKGFLHNHLMRGLVEDPRDGEPPDEDKGPLGRVLGYSGQIHIQERKKVWLNFGIGTDVNNRYGMGDRTKVWLNLGEHPMAPLYFNAGT